MKKFITNLTLALVFMLNSFSFADVVTMRPGPSGSPFDFIEEGGHGDYYAKIALRETMVDYILPLVTIIAIIIVVTLIIIKIKKNKK